MKILIFHIYFCSKEVDHLKARKRVDILETCNYIIPSINCVGKEAVLIYGGLTSYFVKSISVVGRSRVLELLKVYKGLRFRGSFSRR